MLAQGAALAMLCSPLAHAAPPAAPAAHGPKAASGAAQRVATSLRIVIPANAGGGWDQTGRALGAALVASGAAERVEYENVGGKGGTIGLAQFVQRHGSDPDALLIGGMVMVGAVALQKPAVNMSHVQPLARLTSDYLVVAVPADSPIRNAKDLVAALRSDLAHQSFAGGSAGGVDHMFAGLLTRAAKAAPEQLVYKPFPGGAQVVEALLKGEARMGVSGYSEFSEALAASCAPSACPRAAACSACPRSANRGWTPTWPTGVPSSRASRWAQHVPRPCWAPWNRPPSTRAGSARCARTAGNPPGRPAATSAASWSWSTPRPAS
jgi:putative tricarboxylic transport membrane protein